MEPKITVEDLRLFNLMETLAVIKVIVESIAGEKGMSFSSILNEVSNPTNIDINKIITAREVLYKLLAFGVIFKGQLDKYSEEDQKRVSAFASQLSGFTRAQ